MFNWLVCRKKLINDVYILVFILCFDKIVYIDYMYIGIVN